MKDDITGRKFGMLTVIGRDFSFKSPKRTKWICRCDCGNEKSILRDSLMSGRCNSCGCQMYKSHKGINKTHGMSRTRIYHEWTSMRKRCNPNSKDAKNYYDRSISVCDEWQKSFLPFYEWAMANGYDDTLTIDRIDNNKGYYPENCRWVTIAQQQSNKVNTVHIEYEGETYCLRQLCLKIGFPYKTAHQRLRKMQKKGLPVDTDRLFAPIHKEKIPLRNRKQE